MFSKFLVRAVQTSHLPFFSPCTFPSPLYEPIQFRLYCNLMPHLPFICDLHQQLSDSGSTVILEAFEKLKPLLVRNDSSLSLGILVVRQLAPPTSSSVVYNNKHEYGCLFEDECIHMNAEKIQQFVISARTFIKIYTSTLYNRWFLEDTVGNQPNILAIIILDGLVNDVRKLPYVKIYTDNLRLLPSMFNIQSECVNNILQGWPLHMVIADLINQLGHSLHEFCFLDGDIRLHVVPSWAIYIFILCVVLLFLAIFMEWYIVRRKIRYKRTNSSQNLIWIFSSLCSTLEISLLRL
ncbi:Outer membrane protein assembly factor BamE [Dirofilaria immitis]